MLEIISGEWRKVKKYPSVKSTHIDRIRDCMLKNFHLAAQIVAKQLHLRNQQFFIKFKIFLKWTILQPFKYRCKKLVLHNLIIKWYCSHYMLSILSCTIVFYPSDWKHSLNRLIIEMWGQKLNLTSGIRVIIWEWQRKCSQGSRK